MIGFVFADESEAKVFFKRVQAHKSGTGTAFPFAERQILTLTGPFCRQTQIIRDQEEETRKRGQDR